MHTAGTTCTADDPGTCRERVGFQVAEQLDVPLVVIDRQLRLVWANRTARARGGAIWSALFSAECRSAAETVLRNQLQELVDAAVRSGAAAEALVESPDGTWFASVTPVDGCAGLVLLRLAAMRQVPAAVRERLHRLFGLSRAEAQITVQLASGWSLERIAAGRRVSVDTVRAQMRSVFHKTGMHRQGELICAVGTLAAR